MTDPNFQKCWSLDNLQPLSSKENNIKGKKLQYNKPITGALIDNTELYNKLIGKQNAA
jgi:hypothetical protein